MPNNQDIDNILRELAFTWKNKPEMAFGKLVISVLRTGYRSDLQCTALEYIEDEEFLAGLNRLIAGRELYPRSNKSYPSKLQGRPPALISG